MGKIHVLDFSVANLIAAGEVVDRPASVLKELLENAIDAGGKHITAEIANGGIRSIRVLDDGCGMTYEDMPVALRRHATSKISTKEDLDEIATLGFRGEALAAISSVSKMTIISKPQDEEMGYMLSSEGGVVSNLMEVGCSSGTTVLVENLFEHVPARRKFLKKDATEALACQAFVEKVAMSHPEISFRFICDGKVKFATNGDSNKRNVLYALYGKDFASRLIDVSSNSNGILLSGFIGRPDNAHATRNMQNVYINGRYVKSKTVQAALERAFTSYMAPEKFPVATLYLDLDPGQVDVNVHPAKLEVRFSDERVIFDSVYWAVRSALEQDTQRPVLPNAQEQKQKVQLNSFTDQTKKETFEQYQMKPHLPTPNQLGQTREQPKPEEQKDTFTPKESLDFLNSLATLEKEWNEKHQEGQVAKTTTDPEQLIQKQEQVKEEIKEESKNLPDYRIVGIAFRCYIFVELQEKMLVIDQHAAHERILFEKMLKEQQKEERIPTQGLLVPLSVPLSTEEYEKALSNKEEFSSIGFDFVPGKNGMGVALTTLPNQVSVQEGKELFVKLIGNMLESSEDPSIAIAKRREMTLYQIACKGAIKGGRTYTDEEIKWLVEEVLSMPDVTCCPHGRPIAYEVSKKQLDRNFDRIK